MITGLNVSASIDSASRSAIDCPCSFNCAKSRFLRYFSSLRLDGQIRPTRGLSVGFESISGTSIDFENGGIGEGLVFTGFGTARIGRHIDLRGTYARQRLNSVEGTEIFSANVWEVRAVYNFTTRFFVRVAVQRNGTRRNLDVYQTPVDRFRRQTARQLLVSYKINPQSVAFLGYSDDGFLATDAGGGVTDLAPRLRTLFIKLGYAWRP